mgnify:CR=1 FL=1
MIYTLQSYNLFPVSASMRHFFRGCLIKAIYTDYTIKTVHKVHKKVAYHIEKSLFFLRPFYVLSTSFLRNGYMEVRKVHKLYILEEGGIYCLLHQIVMEQ